MMFIGEIGINHNGNLDIAMDLIDIAYENGVDVVKFQKRTPELCVLENEWDKVRETPWEHVHIYSIKMISISLTHIVKNLVFNGQQVYGTCQVWNL